MGSKLENEVTNEVQAQLDPSALTTQQLWREIASLKELLFSKMEAMQEAIKVSHEDFVRFPTDVQNQVSNLKELHEKWFLEKFEGAQKYFIERDNRVEQASREAKICFNESLAEKEKASNKQETYFTKQLDQLTSLINQSEKTVDNRINEIKDRIGKIEGIAIGALNNKVSQQTSSSSVWGIVAVVSSIILGIIGLIAGYVMSR